ncbi:MAG: lipoyl(octanoyl) transferase LipB [Thermoprotei archaeon]
MEYSEAWAIQKGLVAYKYENPDADDFLLLLEHPHVYTVGRKGNTQNVLSSAVQVVHVERGGDVTYHGPGQLVAYPVVSLTRLSLTLRDYVRALEEIGILCARKFGVAASRVEGKTGVWVGDRKIASIGVAVERWITYHGIAFNVNTDLTFFGMINPCGMSASVMTSLKALTHTEIPMEKVKNAFIEAYSHVMSHDIRPANKEEEFLVREVWKQDSGLLKQNTLTGISS